MTSMKYEETTIKTETGIESEVITLQIGSAHIHVYTHGSTNTLHAFNSDVTSQRELETMLVRLDELFKQRGGNPFLGPMAGRYDSSRIAQPGTMDIHGVFAGLSWNILDVNVDEGYVELELPATKWKGELKTYYYFAALEPENFSSNKQSLIRLLNAMQNVYIGTEEITDLNELQLLLAQNDTLSNLNRIEDLTSKLVDLAFPGEATIVRRITVNQVSDEVVDFLDMVTIKNTSTNENYLDSSGYHTYFNTFLEEIVLPNDFWKNGIIQDFDDNLADVTVRELNQVGRLRRRIFIIPEGELQSSHANQIIYRDLEMIGYPEAAIENWYQPGSENHYPHKGRIIRPGETAYYGVRIIVVQGNEIPEYVQQYVDEVNGRLTLQP